MKTEGAQRKITEGCKLGREQQEENNNDWCESAGGSPLTTLHGCSGPLPLPDTEKRSFMTQTRTVLRSTAATSHLKETSTVKT